jgi:dynein heavy chain
MTIILEAEDLSNCTPATISRCGMIYMRDDIVPLKGIVNQFIKKLPPFLEDAAEELDQLCNYYIPDILDKFMLQQNLVRQN